MAEERAEQPGVEARARAMVGSTTVDEVLREAAEWEERRIRDVVEDNLSLLAFAAAEYNRSLLEAVWIAGALCRGASPRQLKQLHGSLQDKDFPRFVDRVRGMIIPYGRGITESYQVPRTKTETAGLWLVPIGLLAPLYLGGLYPKAEFGALVWLALVGVAIGYALILAGRSD